MNFVADEVRMRRLFSDLVFSGRAGLYITDREPASLDQRPVRGSASYIWLSPNKARSTPSEPLDIECRIERFLDECAGGVVAVDCTQERATARSANALPDSLLDISRKAETRGAYVLIHLR